METKKRKFFADLLNAARELQLQVQAAQKRRKQRNDGVQACYFCFLDFSLYYIFEIFSNNNFMTNCKVKSDSMPSLFPVVGSDYI